VECSILSAGDEIGVTGEKGGDAGGRRVAAAAALLAASFFLSRVLGFVREAVLAYRLGVGADTDAYYAAFQIPDMLNHFLGIGALSIALIPLYTRILTERGEEAANRVFATVLGTLGLVALLATSLLWWFAEPLVILQFPDFAPDKQALTVRLTRIVLPAQIFFVCGGILRAVLMAKGRFGAQAAAPLIYNAGIITGGLFLAPALGVDGFAWGALAGAALGPFGYALLDARGRVPFRLRIAPLDPDFLRYLLLAAPLMIGVTLLTMDEWYDRWFGGVLGAGTIGLVVYARRLMQAPVAVVGQTAATAALPTLSKLVAEARWEELSSMVLRTLQLAIGLGVLAGAATFALADPFVALVYLRGAFGEGDARAVADTLRVFSLAVPAWIAQTIAVRPFYARRDFWRPMLLGTAIAVLAIPLYLMLGPPFGARGLAGAGALAITANALATLALARRLHGAPHFAPLASTALRAVLISLPAAAAAFYCQPGLGGGIGALVDLAVGGIVFALLAIAGALLVGDAPMRETLSEAWGSLARRRRAA
jgi:putative peptidoglycan lipid II flippase